MKKISVALDEDRQKILAELNNLESDLSKNNAEIAKIEQDIKNAQYNLDLYKKRDDQNYASIQKYQAENERVTSELSQ